MNEAAEKLRGEGHNVLAVTCDVSDKAQVAAMIDLAVKTYGRLDAAFNNAGINCAETPMVETDDEVFDRLININLRGAWNCMKGELRQMVAQGSGAIVNCSSIGGIVGSPGRTAYSASKHAIIGLTQSAAFEYANSEFYDWPRDGVRWRLSHPIERLPTKPDVWPHQIGQG